MLMMFMLNMIKLLPTKLVGSQRVQRKLGEQIGVSMNQIRRFIRLTYLIEPLQEMVDGRNENEIKIAFNPAC